MLLYISVWIDKIFMGADMLNLAILRENWIHVNQTKNFVCKSQNTKQCDKYDEKIKQINEEFKVNTTLKSERR